MTQKHNNKPLPRPQCEGCPILNHPSGCGWLQSGTPCKHSIERHRFDLDETEIETPAMITGEAAQMSLFT